MNEFKTGYQPGSNLVKCEMMICLQITAVSLIDGRITFAIIECTWVKDVRKTEIHTAEPLVPESSCFGVKIAIEKLKRYNHQLLIKFQNN
jgi:hypothetical protein